MATRRQRILDLLQQRAEGWSPRELAELLEAQERVVLEDLGHVQRSLKRTGLAMLMLPARCKQCAWEAAADEPRSPAKCARCRSTWLDDARFRVAPR